MSNDSESSGKDSADRVSDRGLQRRHEDYVRVMRETRDPRAATAAYCAGNVWLEENARAVGNL